MEVLNIRQFSVGTVNGGGGILYYTYYSNHHRVRPDDDWLAGSFFLGRYYNDIRSFSVSIEIKAVNIYIILTYKKIEIWVCMINHLSLKKRKDLTELIVLSGLDMFDLILISYLPNNHKLISCKY